MSSRQQPPMQHSHEALDRPGGFGRGNLLSPLKHRDFRILWTGMTISLIGDGIFLIAIAWESYSLWNTPAALSIVGIGMTIPTIAFLLIGGVVSDRRDRRGVMGRAEGVRAAPLPPLAGLLPILTPPLLGAAPPAVVLRPGRPLFLAVLAAHLAAHP